MFSKRDTLASLKLALMIQKQGGDISIKPGGGIDVVSKNIPLNGKDVSNFVGLRKCDEEVMLELLNSFRHNGEELSNFTNELKAYSEKFVNLISERIKLLKYIVAPSMELFQATLSELKMNNEFAPLANDVDIGVVTLHEITNDDFYKELMQYDKPGASTFFSPVPNLLNILEGVGEDPKSFIEGNLGSVDELISELVPDYDTWLKLVYTGDTNELTENLIRSNVPNKLPYNCSRFGILFINLLFYYRANAALISKSDSVPISLITKVSGNMAYWIREIKNYGESIQHNIDSGAIIYKRGTVYKESNNDKVLSYLKSAVFVEKNLEEAIKFGFDIDVLDGFFISGDDVSKLNLNNKNLEKEIIRWRSLKETFVNERKLTFSNNIRKSIFAHIPKAIDKVIMAQEAFYTEARVNFKTTIPLVKLDLDLIMEKLNEVKSTYRTFEVDDLFNLSIKIVFECIFGIYDKTIVNIFRMMYEYEGDDTDGTYVVIMAEYIQSLVLDNLCEQIEIVYKK